MLVRTIFLLAACAVALAQDVPLTKEQIAAGAMDESFSLPMPGELFAALGKNKAPDWGSLVRKTPAGAFTTRQQIALNLGALVADGYVAIEAQDKQLVKNISKDIRTLAKGVGVGDELIQRGNSIVEFADSGQWDALKEELEATQNEVIAAMKAHKDQDLVTLVMLGGWLRGTEVVSAHLAKYYDADKARVLRQPAIVNHFVQKLAKMPEKFLDTPVMTSVRLALFKIKAAVTFADSATPAEDDVRKLSELAAETMKVVKTKQ